MTDQERKAARGGRPSRLRRSKLAIFSELWQFLRVRKKWWLAPILFMLILIGLLAIFVQGSPLAPFIYALF